MLRMLKDKGGKWGEALLQAVREDWVAWKAARLAQGAAAAPGAPVPEIRHPDLAREFDEMPPEQVEPLCVLQMGRVLYLASLSADEIAKWIAVGEGTAEFSEAEIERHAENLHNVWWVALRCCGPAGGAGVFAAEPGAAAASRKGDEAWAEQDEPSKRNDKVLVAAWAERLAKYAKSEDPAHRAFMALIRKTR